jgi:hypothetical protein
MSGIVDIKIIVGRREEEVECDRRVINEHRVVFENEVETNKVNGFAYYVKELRYCYISVDVITEVSLEMTILQMITNGWVMQGGSTYAGGKWSQTMIKYKKENKLSLANFIEDL